ncbi:MAG: zinc ribbon domain-containing protein [Candidatus Eremiobacteraeota bacterium]|nr:zinc ribbon domain-containing protein [Candidatus Eremiobacteraeota bacterium]
MICIKCGYENAVGSNYCDQCFSPLPRLELFQVFEPTIVTGRVKKIQTHCEMIQKTEITPEEFSEFVTVTYEELTRISGEIQEIVDSAGYRDISPDEVEIGYEGMTLYEQGLQEIYLYVEDMNPEHFSAGMEMINQGNLKINEAMKINRDNRERDGVQGTL